MDKKKYLYKVMRRMHKGKGVYDLHITQETEDRVEFNYLIVNKDNTQRRIFMCMSDKAGA